MKTAIVASISPTSFEALALSDDVTRAFKLVSDYGFNGIEIAVRDPDQVSAKDMLRLCRDYNLEIAAIGTGQAYVEDGLSLTSTDRENRKRAKERLKRHIELSSELGALVIIGLVRGKVSKKSEAPKALDLLLECMAELSEYAKAVGAPGLLIEPINRYETGIINSVQEAAEFLDRLRGLPVKILADAFHMNIEDRDMAASLREAGHRLGHVHLADSNRRAPGQGHIEFEPIIKALHEINYKGHLSAEILPEPDPESALQLTAEFFDRTLGLKRKLEMDE